MGWRRLRRISASILGGTWIEKAWNLVIFWVKKWIDVANGTHNLIQGWMACSLVKSFRRASRSPAVQVTGSANALSRWEGASPLGGVWGGWQRIGLPNQFFGPEVGKGWKRSENVQNDRKRIGLSNPDLFSWSFFSWFLVDFGGVLGVFWEVIFVLCSKTSIL